MNWLSARSGLLTVLLLVCGTLCICTPAQAKGKRNAAMSGQTIPIAAPPPGKALIYIYFRGKHGPVARRRIDGDALAGTFYANGAHFSAPPRGTYQAFEVPAAPSGPNGILFTEKCLYTPPASVSGIGVIHIRYRPPTEGTRELLRLKVEAGKIYYVQYGAGQWGMKLMKEAQALKETKGFSPSAPAAIPAP
jgi:hypothetical protein